MFTECWIGLDTSILLSLSLLSWDRLALCFRQTKKPNSLARPLRRSPLGSPAFHYSGSATFRPYLTIGLALVKNLNHIYHKYSNISTEHFSQLSDYPAIEDFPMRQSIMVFTISQNDCIWQLRRSAPAPLCIEPNICNEQITIGCETLFHWSTRIVNA